MFDLGNRAKDVITGYKGVIMAKIQYLTGCDQYALLKEKLNKDDKVEDWKYFDVSRLKKLRGKITLQGVTTEIRKTGADGNLPSETRHP